MALDITSYLLGKKGGSSSKGLKVEVVQELPTTGETDILYLVPKTTTGTNNVFEEYLYVNDNWELIGTTDIDLSGYQTTANLVTSLSSQSTDTQYPSAKCVYNSIVPEVYYTGKNGSGNPFVFDGKKKGIYYINSPHDESFFYYKFKSTDSSTMFSYKVEYIILNEDINIDNITTGTHFGYIKFLSYGNFQVAEIYKTSDKWFNVTNPMYLALGGLVINGSQSWSGVKTFNAIPKQSDTTAPTQDAEFTNKKYVDDSIASAIGTALGGSY